MSLRGGGESVDPCAPSEESRGAHWTRNLCLRRDFVQSMPLFAKDPVLIRSSPTNIELGAAQTPSKNCLCPYWTPYQVRVSQHYQSVQLTAIESGQPGLPGPKSGVPVTHACTECAVVVGRSPDDRRRRRRRPPSDTARETSPYTCGRHPRCTCRSCSGYEGLQCCQTKQNGMDHKSILHYTLCETNCAWSMDTFQCKVILNYTNQILLQKYEHN